MEARQFRHVLALVECGNFHKAAESLRVTQPALSKSIQGIERELGVRLFDRHGKAVAPTVFGTLAAKAARQVVDAIDGLARAIEQTTALDAGELSVGAGPYAADVWFGQVAGRVLRAHPGLRITLHVEPWEALPEALRSGRIDLSVANSEPVRGRREFRVVEFPSQPGIWVCRAGHPLALREKPGRAALLAYPLIGPHMPESILRWLEAGTRAHPSVLARKIDTTSMTMVKAMIREGDAVSLVHPASVRAELRSGEFATLELDAPPLAFDSGLAWLSDRSLSPAALAFARELLAEVGLDPESHLN
ncbi:HTH-type transcriptional regulator GbpR [Aquisphaera giovannonii]|uniref:HTH-type transcriptional regulator GbpR n=1 Tax=Aquisphaera giovannonii TaxID=406548 RepID=A0A5B9WCB5_9BACT|nr:LysR family transcriptional regulator [Aquisphaera giovannonii]QEH38222.1 HTH-type transcriptional regulator GbpR [Aquisphaera giovannonii]